MAIAGALCFLATDVDFNAACATLLLMFAALPGLMLRHAGHVNVRNALSVDIEGVDNAPDMLLSLPMLLKIAQTRNIALSTVGALVGKAQRYVAQVQAEVSRSIELEELNKMKAGFQTAASEVSQSLIKDR